MDFVLPARRTVPIIQSMENVECVWCEGKGQPMGTVGGLLWLHCTNCDTEFQIVWNEDNLG